MKNNSKDFGGIVGHEKESEIADLMRELKNSGLGYRKIAPQIKLNFDIAPSHTTVSKYMKEVLEYIEPTATAPETEQLQAVEVDPDRINEIRKILGSDKWDSSNENPTKDIYAKVLALVEQNVHDHMAGKARLKIEYVKYLYDLKRLMKGGIW